MSSLLSVSEIKALCAQYRIRPTKDRGQNFLIDERVAQETIHAANLHLDDEVIEVGPGFGALTFGLAACAKQVTAVEIEPKLILWLREEMKRRGVKNVETVEGDAIQFISSSAHQWQDFVVIASLPYQITSDFFSALLKDDCVPRRLVLIIQKEVAERLHARPPHMSLLSVIVQWYGKVKLVREVPRSAFWPQPAVESALVRIDTQGGARLIAPLRTHCGVKIRSENFFDFIKPAFRFPRRKIANTIEIRADSRLHPRSSALWEKRPGELGIDDWIALFRAQ